MTSRLALPALLLTILFVPGEARAAQTPASGPDSTVYRIDPTSRLVVKTGKAGLFGFAGHTHVIQAHGVDGELVHRAARKGSSLHLTIPTDSLEVLTPPDTEEIRKVTESMRTDVLHVDRYPEMRFAADSLEARNGRMSFPLQVTMGGTTRDIPVTAEVTITPDSVRAVGTFTAKQTDFGIEPYSGGPGGTVKVADKVTFCFDLVGRTGARPDARSGGRDARSVPGCEDMPQAGEKGKRPM
ncbi:MAG TPA: YceI family protein [Gemmatimonadales bacterium]|nr:YceI family protein [Gemmatimonadales bacterium]